MKDINRVMKAIIPLNITALRVSYEDSKFKTVKFKHRLANFDESNGGSLIQPLEYESNKGFSLGAGVHLHWSLPNYFRKGSQDVDSGNFVFPQAPNRWLVVRHLSMINSGETKVEMPKTKAWIVESDYISKKQECSIKQSTPIPPLYVGDEKHNYMGRTIELEKYHTTESGKYLSDAVDEKDRSVYLTSVGFIGPTFSSSYPDCSSVFGFWDDFSDNDSLKSDLDNNKYVNFKVSYQVIGWIKNSIDPLKKLLDKVTNDYNIYAKECKKERVSNDKNIETMFLEQAEFSLGWKFDKNQLQNNIPTQSICNGIIQEIIFESRYGSKSSFFKTESEDGEFLISNDIDIAIGNTSEDAVSAFLNHKVHSTDAESSLNTLQFDSLKSLDNRSDLVAKVYQAIHRNSFARIDGGTFWSVQKRSDKKNSDSDKKSPVEEANLPIKQAQMLSELNKVQKKYDCEREVLREMSAQLFRDWHRLIAPNKDLSITVNEIKAFFIHQDNHTGLSEIKTKEENSEKLFYTFLDDERTIVSGIKEPSRTETLAYKVWISYNTLLVSLGKDKWDIIPIAAPEFYAPTDLVALMHGDYLGATLPNGKDDAIYVRTSEQIIDTLDVTIGDMNSQIKADDLLSLSLTEREHRDEITALLNEGVLLMPIFADSIGAKCKVLRSKSNSVSTLRELQGGLHPKSKEAKKGGGLFERVRAADYKFDLNPTLESDSMRVVFLNKNKSAVAPNAVEWSTPESLSGEELNAFIPLSIIWSVGIKPLVKDRKVKDADYPNYRYSPEILKSMFKFNEEFTDYIPNVSDTTFVNSKENTFIGSTFMAKKSTKAIVTKLKSFLDNNPESENIKSLLVEYEKYEVLSNSLNGINDFSILQRDTPYVDVRRLTYGITRIEHSIELAANRYKWYENDFHSALPISKGSAALNGFNPLRGGLVSFKNLEVVDVFGQRIKLRNAPEDRLLVVPAKSLRSNRSTSFDDVYLPPRFIMPTRFWFKFLNAEQDFVEMNNRLSSSPICGWLMLNLVDKSLYFYNANGRNIGFFRYEANKIKYRTGYENTSNNSKDNLDIDLTTQNSHLANFMRYIVAKSDDQGDMKGNNMFLYDLMTCILNSQKFLNSHNADYSTSQSVFAGNPLAIVRTEISIESLGGVVPIDQVDIAGTSSALISDVKNRRSFKERMENNSAGVCEVKVPVYLGKLNGLNDGLVGFIIEKKLGDTIGYSDFYVPNCNYLASKTSSIKLPGLIKLDASYTPLQLKVNAPPINLMMVIDPRAEINAKTCLLPDSTLSIPSAQYTEALESLSLNFEMRPVLRPATGFNIPLSKHTEKQWSWRDSASDKEVLLGTDSSNQWGYTPQTIKEGWVMLKPKDSKK